MQRYDNPYPIEKIISAATYMTAGGAGFIWLIIAAIFKKTVQPFLMYHILQSIFLSILFFLLKVFTGFIILILLKIPFISLLVGKLVYYAMIPIPLFFNLDIIRLVTTSVIMYLAITSFLGYYSYIPWVSEVISGNFKQK